MSVAETTDPIARQRVEMVLVLRALGNDRDAICRALSAKFGIAWTQSKAEIQHASSWLRELELPRDDAEKRSELIAMARRTWHALADGIEAADPKDRAALGLACERVLRFIGELERVIAPRTGGSVSVSQEQNGVRRELKMSWGGEASDGGEPITATIEPRRDTIGT